MSDSDHLIDQAHELFCHGLARIDHLGVNRRLVFTTPSLEVPQFQHVVVKLILPADLMVTLAYMAAGAERSVSPALIGLETRVAN